RLSGAEYAPTIPTAPAPANSAVQWVLLDFDSQTTGREHVYTTDERNAIAGRIEGYYRGPDSSSPWFRVRAVQQPGDIPAGLPYSTLIFNEDPSFGRPGGEADAIDFQNLDLGGSAVIQVNGLLGADDQPEATSDNFVRLSAKIGAHELGHLMG